MPACLRAKEVRGGEGGSEGGSEGSGQGSGEGEGDRVVGRVVRNDESCGWRGAVKSYTCEGDSKEVQKR